MRKSRANGKRWLRISEARNYGNEKPRPQGLRHVVGRDLLPVGMTRKWNFIQMVVGRLAKITLAIVPFDFYRDSIIGTLLAADD